MTTAADQPVSLVVDLKDRASAGFDKLTSSTGRFGLGLRQLLPRIAGVLSGLTGLRGLLILVGAAMAAMPLVGAAIGLVQFGQASRRAQIQLQLFGLNAADAKERVDSLSRALDRNTTVSILRNIDAVGQLIELGPDLSLQFADIARQLGELTDIDPGEAFTALAEALTEGDFSKLKIIFGDAEDLAEAASKLEEGDFAGFLETLSEALKGLDPENVTKLGLAMKEIAEQSLPFREFVTEFVAGMTTVLAVTLSERIANLKDDAKIIAALVLLGALWGTLTANSFGTGFRGGIGGLIA